MFQAYLSSIAVRAQKILTGFEYIVDTSNMKPSISSIMEKLEIAFTVQFVCDRVPAIVYK